MDQQPRSSLRSGKNRKQRARLVRRGRKPLLRNRQGKYLLGIYLGVSVNLLTRHAKIDHKFFARGDYLSLIVTRAYAILMAFCIISKLALCLLVVHQELTQMNNADWPGDMPNPTHISTEIGLSAIGTVLGYCTEYFEETVVVTETILYYRGLPNLACNLGDSIRYAMSRMARPLHSRIHATISFACQCEDGFQHHIIGP